MLTFPSVPAISLPVVLQENTPGMRGDHLVSKATSPCPALGSSERTSPLFTSHSRARPSRPVLVSRLGSWGHHPMLSTPCRQGSNQSSREYGSPVRGVWGLDLREHRKLEQERWNKVKPPHVPFPQGDLADKNSFYGLKGGS